MEFFCYNRYESIQIDSKERGEIKMKNKKMLISWLVVVAWAIVIFNFSGMDYYESNRLSGYATTKIIESTATNKPNTNQNINKEADNQEEVAAQKQNKIKSLHYYVRKGAHASIYFVLTILIVIALYISGLRDIRAYLVAILICFLYACTDEFHQVFVPGRTGQFKDVIIDTIGGIIGIILVLTINSVVKLIKQRR